MTVILRLSRAAAFLALAATFLATPADAQRRGTSFHSVTLGGGDLVFATQIFVGRALLTSRTDLSRVTEFALQGVTGPSSGYQGGTCDFEAPTCDGRVKVADPTSQTGLVCYELYDVAITSAIDDAADKVYRSPMQFSFERIERAGPCADE